MTDAGKKKVLYNIVFKERQRLLREVEVSAANRASFLRNLSGIVSPDKLVVEERKLLRLVKEMNDNVDKPLIEDFSFKRVVIRGKVYNKDVIVMSDGVVRHPWKRRRRHICSMVDLDFGGRRVDHLIIGRGTEGKISVDMEVFTSFDGSVSTGDTVDAIAKFTSLSQQLKGTGERVAAYLHVSY